MPSVFKTAIHKIVILAAVLVVLGGCSSLKNDSRERELHPGQSADELHSIVALGDSNTQAWAPIVLPDFPFGWGVRREEQYLVRLLMRLNPGERIVYRNISPWDIADARSPATDKVFVSGSYVIHNMGFAGAESKDLAGLQHRNSLVDQSDVLIVAIGTNDLVRGVPIEGTVANVTKVIEHAIGVGATVVVCGVPPAAPEYFASRDADVLNHELKRMAVARGIVFVDLDAALDTDSDSVNDCPLNESDYLHFSAEGHQRIADAFPIEMLQR